MTAGFQYRFVTTVDDLIDADAIDRAQQPIRLYRWLADLVGGLEAPVLWAVTGLLTVGLFIFALASSWTDRLAIGSVAGLLLLYHFVIAPRRARARIRAARPARQTVQLEVGKDGVSMAVENAGPVRTPWHEFTGIAASRRGILLYFESIKLWLPTRAFDNDQERHAFVQFVKQYEPTDTPL